MSNNKQKINFIKSENITTIIMSPFAQKKYIWGDKTMLTIFTFKKSAIVDWHSHDAEQITHILSGKVKFLVGEQKQEFILEANDSIVIPSNISHYVEVIEDTIEVDSFSPARYDWLAKEVN